MLDIPKNDTCLISYPAINKLFILIFCGYVIEWYLQLGIRVPVLGSIRFEFIYAIILIILAVAFTPHIELDCELLPYVLLLSISILVQVPLSYDIDTSIVVFIDRVFKFSFMAFFIVAFVRSPDNLKWFIAAFLLACFKMGQEGLVGKITGSMVWENQGVMRLNGPTPIYAHPNSYSGMALGTLPFVYYLWSWGNKYIKSILALLGILSINIIVFTGSRTGYVGIIILFIFIFMNSRSKIKWLACFALFATLAIQFIPSSYHERFNSIFTGQEKEGRSSEKRIEILKDAWQIFIDNPLGIGVAAFPKKRMDVYGRGQDTHNLYLEIATNLGIQGLGAFIALIFVMLRTLNRVTVSLKCKIEFMAAQAINDVKIRSDLQFLLAISLAVSCFIIIRLALGLFGMDLYEIYWWFAIGITVSLYNINNVLERNISGYIYKK